MTTENAATTDTAAVGQHGATVGPERASSKKADRSKKGGPKRQKIAKGGKPKAPSTAKREKATPARKAAKAPQKAPKPKAGGVREGSKTAAVLAIAAAAQGCHPHRDHGNHVLAGPQRPRFHQHPEEEDGAGGDFHQARRRRPRLQRRQRGGLAMATSVWKGHISFGLVAFPVKLHAAARSQAVSFNQLHQCDHSRVKQVLYCQAEDKPVSRSELVKGFEYEKDRYVVVVEERELAQMAPRSSRVMEVLEFVPAVEVDPVYLDASYYVVPERAGEKPYTLLCEALRRSRAAKVARAG
jgi:hypothetical protein